MNNKLIGADCIKQKISGMFRDLAADIATGNLPDTPTLEDDSQGEPLQLERAEHYLQFHWKRYVDKRESETS